MPDPNPWKPDPRDSRTPIGPGDTISMHREHIYRLAPLGMPDHCRESADDMLIGGGVELGVGQLHDMRKQGFMVHGLRIADCWGGFHSYFPMVA